MVFINILFVNGLITAAVFTIENYTGQEISVELRLDKSWGSATKQAKIMTGTRHIFNTGIYGIPRGGIMWESGGDSYFLSGVAIDKPFMIGGIIRLFKTGTYEFKFSDGSSGYGNIKKIE